MLRHLLRHIRRQPRAHRESYAFVGAILVTTAITLVWATQLPQRLAIIGSVELPGSPTIESEQIPQTSNPPFSNFISRIQAAVSEFTVPEAETSKISPEASDQQLQHTPETVVPQSANNELEQGELPSVQETSLTETDNPLNTTTRE